MLSDYDIKLTGDSNNKNNNNSNNNLAVNSLVCKREPGRTVRHHHLDDVIER